MNFPQIRAFHLVVKEGGVGRAARVSGVSQPTISQHIKALEARYGAPLFEKRGRSLQPTEAARELFSVTEALIRAADDVDAALGGRPDVSSGRLRLVSDHVTIAVELIDLFRRRHPGVTASLRVASMPQIMAAVADASADAGITVEPPAGDDLVIRPLASEPLDVVSARSHGFARLERVGLADLATETLLLREPGSRTRALTERALEAAGVAPRAVLELGSREAIREAAARGMGVSLMGRLECPPDPRLARTPLAAAHARVAFDEHLVIRRDRRRSPVVAAFADLAARYAPGVRTV